MPNFLDYTKLGCAVLGVIALGIFCFFTSQVSLPVAIGGYFIWFVMAGSFAWFAFFKVRNEPTKCDIDSEIAGFESVQEPERHAPQMDNFVERIRREVSATLFLSFLGTCLFCAVSIALIFRFCHAWKSEQWPSVIGKVQHSSIGVDQSGEKPKYFPVVRYQYSVNGVGYQGERMSFGPRKSSAISGVVDKLIIQKYRMGSDISVFYNAADPRDSVLKPGASEEILLLAGVSAALGLAGGYFIRKQMSEPRH